MGTGIVIGIVAGVTLGWLIAFFAMPGLMFRESASKLGFNETVTLIEEQVTARGWKMPAIHDLQATMKKFDRDVMSVKVFEICHPDYSYNILKESEERFASSMMPCRISVYEKEDGSVWISRMNSGVVARAMSKIIRKSMTDAAADVELIIAEVPAD